jgi:hypothetical protein
MTGNWQDSLRERFELLQGPPIYRHAQSFVKVSHLAAQYFCELKLHFDITRGEVPTEGKIRGIRIHREVLPMKKIPLEQLRSEIETKPQLISTFLLVAKAGELVVAGLPDAIMTSKGVPRFLIELKTTEVGIGRLWEGEAVQARVYGLLLDVMGFDCSGLKLAIVKTCQSLLSCQERRKLMSRIVGILLGDPRDVESEYKGQMRVFGLPYSRTEAMRDVILAQDYWLCRREAVPTNSVGKCRRCVHGSICQYSDRKKV